MYKVHLTEKKSGVVVWSLEEPFQSLESTREEQGKEGESESKRKGVRRGRGCYCLLILRSTAFRVLEAEKAEEVYTIRK